MRSSGESVTSVFPVKVTRTIAGNMDARGRSVRLDAEDGGTAQISPARQLVQRGVRAGERPHVHRGRQSGFGGELQYFPDVGARHVGDALDLPLHPEMRRVVDSRELLA